jgi:hypothetical protein
MTIAASYIFSQVTRETNDDTAIRWTMPELAGYFNDGQRDISMHRPDAMNTRVSHALVAGAKQSLPAGGEKLIDINNNTSGLGSISQVNRRILDEQTRGWRALPGATTIQHFMYDPRDPRTFEVYPPAAVGASVELEYAAIPANIAIPAAGSLPAAAVGNMTLGDLFANALVNYILYRCYRKDTEYTANPQRAVAYYQAYINDLGIEAKGNLMALMPATPMPQQTA